MSELMKGHKWRDHAKKMNYPAWVEVKSDEIRCHIIVTPAGTWDVQFLSYARRRLANMESFAPQWRELSQATGITEFDTGFEVNENFNDSYRWVRSTKGLPADLKDATAHFWLFDLPQGYEGMQFSDRVVHRRNAAVLAQGMGMSVAEPHGTWARNAEDVTRLFVHARGVGHEGIMVKDIKHEYRRGTRSYGWLKVKPEDDEDGIVTGFTEAVSEDGWPLGRVGSLEVVMSDGSKANPAGIAHDLGKAIFENFEKYRGQWVEFKFMERDRDGGYRHPFFNRFREAKE